MITQNRDENFRDSNKAAMEYGRNSIQFSFLLNGAAATALLAKKCDTYVAAATTLGIGACFAVICMGMAYITQLLLCETWRQDGPIYDIMFFGKWIKVSRPFIEWMRVVAAGLWIVSIVLFFIGIINAARV